MNQEEYSLLLKKYKERLEIEEYQRKRILSVPNTNYWQVTAYTMLYVTVVFCIIRFFPKLFPSTYICSIIITIAILLIFSDYYFRFLGVKAIECYQHYANEELRRRCNCIPSCSEYAILCMKKYEFIYGLIKIRRRLYVTCRSEEYIIDWPT